MKILTEARADVLWETVSRNAGARTIFNTMRKHVSRVAIGSIIQWTIAVIIVSGLCGPNAKAQTGIPAQNKAIYLSWGGYVDTDAEFANFFDSDHTLMCWFMPQFLYAYKGPIFASTGIAAYFFGMEDYRLGDGGYLDEGNPVMFLQIEDQSKHYLVPNLTKDVWHHFAVVRASNVVSVYLDGGKLTPVLISDRAIVQDEDILLSSRYSNLPFGKLRLGRKGTSLATTTQAYGLLDDVAVFGRALSQREVLSIRSAKRLTGAERGLEYGWCFDQPLRWEPPLPALLDSDATYSPRAVRVLVTPDRFSVADKDAYYAPSLPNSVSQSLQLPFNAEEVWKVIQGYDSPGGSHNGFAAFCYDFVLANSDPGISTYPHGTAYAPIYSASSGTVATYIKDGGYNSAGQERNVVNITTGPNEFLAYIHNQPNSINPSLDTGVCNAATDVCTFRLGGAPPVQPGEFLAKVGIYARHLHFAAHNKLSIGFVTFPVAFDNYYASDDQGLTWTYVSRGYPRLYQWIKRGN
jgi:hypothetical protein